MKTTPIRAIRARCLECAGSRKGVRDCHRGPGSKQPCAAYPFRMGRNPARAGIGRALTAESARSMKERTSQDDGSARNFVRPGEGTGKMGSSIVGDSCLLPDVRVDGPRTSAEIIASEMLRGLSGSGK